MFRESHDKAISGRRGGGANTLHEPQALFEIARGGVALISTDRSRDTNCQTATAATHSESDIYELNDFQLVNVVGTNAASRARRSAAALPGHPHIRLKLESHQTTSWEAEEQEKDRLFLFFSSATRRIDKKNK